MELRVGISQAAIEQWGNLWAGYTEVLNWYFPLTTSQVYAVCLTKHTKNISSGHNWEPARIEEWNNSYARIHPDGDLGYSVIAICKAQQQWGINTGGAVRTSTLPIPFTNVFLAVASTSSEWCCPGCSATNTTVTTRAYQSNRPDVAQPNDVNWIIIGCQPQWGYYTAAVGAIYTDVTTPVSFSRCFLATSIDILLAASTTWPGTTQTVWNINASTANKLRFIWAKAPIELDGAVWFGIFIQTVGKNLRRYC